MGLVEVGEWPPVGFVVCWEPALWEGLRGRMNGEIFQEAGNPPCRTFHVSEHFMFCHSLGLGIPEAGEFCTFSYS